MVNTSSDPRLELSKLEYEKAAERYHNIYQSIWTIFSYMSAVSAALLAFGAERIDPHALAWIAPIPLVFWFWTTYLPLDRYGNRTLQRLRDIEKRLNAVHAGADLQHFTQFARDHHSILVSLSRAVRKRPRKWRDVRKQILRARFAIWVSFLILHVAAIWGLSIWLRTDRQFFKEVSDPQHTPQSVVHQQFVETFESLPAHADATHPRAGQSPR